MARVYRPVDRDQEFLLPPSMLDWLPGDHLVWFVIAAVQRLDTARFHTRARLGGVGRRGYDPDMLLTLFVYAMAHGVRSSRQIERLCHTDVAFRIICAADVPDHSVLARFRKDHEAALEDLLAQTLLLCAELGMVRLGVVAFDGTKIAANAAKDANVTEAHLRRLAATYLSEADATDAAEDDQFGPGVRGDEIPASVRDRTGRAQRIDAALAQVQARQRAEAERAEDERAAGADYVAELADPHAPRRGRPRKAADPVAVARARWERECARAQARIDAHAERLAARGPKFSGHPPAPVAEQTRVRRARAAYDAARAAQATDADTDKAQTERSADDKPQPAKANLTDPDSRLLKTRNGFIQGYNCQTATSQDGFIVTARTTQDHNDVEQFLPTMTDVLDTAERLTAHTGRDDLTVGTMIGDAGYDSEPNLTTAGPDRLIADSKSHQVHRRATQHPATGDPPPDATAREKMNHRLRTTDGHTLYKHRAHLVEAPNAWLKDRRGLRRFSRRSLTATQSELAFAAAVTNLLKLATTGITATQLRTG